MRPTLKSLRGAFYSKTYGHSGNYFSCLKMFPGVTFFHFDELVQGIGICILIKKNIIVWFVCCPIQERVTKFLYQLYKLKIIPKKVCIMRLYTIQYCVFRVNQLIHISNCRNLYEAEKAYLACLLKSTKNPKTVTCSSG